MAELGASIKWQLNNILLLLAWLLGGGGSPQVHPDGALTGIVALGMRCSCSTRKKLSIEGPADRSLVPASILGNF